MNMQPWRVCVVDGLSSDVVVDDTDGREAAIRLRRGLAVEHALGILADLARPADQAPEGTDEVSSYLLAGIVRVPEQRPGAASAPASIQGVSGGESSTP